MTIKGLRHWHRTLGITATLFILVLVLSGLALNHSGALGLDRIFIENGTILDWYGIKPHKAPVSFRAGPHRVTQIDRHLYFDAKDLPDSPEELRGAVGRAGLMLVAFTNSAFVLTDHGDLVEKLGPRQGFPSAIREVGLGVDGQLLIRTGTGILTTGGDMQYWRPYPGSAGYWSVSDNLPRSLKDTLIRRYRGKGLSLEKLLLDLHSGRIFGQAGVYLVDLCAIIFIILAISGCWLWLKHRALQRGINADL